MVKKRKPPDPEGFHICVDIQMFLTFHPGGMFLGPFCMFHHYHRSFKNTVESFFCQKIVEILMEYAPQ